MQFKVIMNFKLKGASLWTYTEYIFRYRKDRIDIIMTSNFKNVKTIGSHENAPNCINNTDAPCKYYCYSCLRSGQTYA